MLQIEERQLESGIVLLQVSGRLALGRESQRLEMIAAQLADKGAPRVIVDLTQVEYIDSAGVGVLAMVSGRVKEAGGKMATVVTEGRVLNVLKLARVDGLLNVNAAMESAAAAVA
jgi:anti-anti-sigma factor